MISVAPILETLCSLFVVPSLLPVLLAVFDPVFLSVCRCPSSGPISVSSDFCSHDRGVFIIFIITLTNAGRSLQEIPVPRDRTELPRFIPPGGCWGLFGWASPLHGDRPCPGLWLVANRAARRGWGRQVLPLSEPTFGVADPG